MSAINTPGTFAARDASPEVTSSLNSRLSGILALHYIASRYLAPAYIDNETAYAIGPMRVLQPDSLAGPPWSPPDQPVLRGVRYARLTAPLRGD
jgi:hypothetical protein